MNPVIQSEKDKTSVVETSKKEYDSMDQTIEPSHQTTKNDINQHIEQIENSNNDDNNEQNRIDSSDKDDQPSSNE